MNWLCVRQLNETHPIENVWYVCPVRTKKSKNKCSTLQTGCRMLFWRETRRKADRDRLLCAWCKNRQRRRHDIGVKRTFRKHKLMFLFWWVVIRFYLFELVRFLFWEQKNRETIKTKMLKQEFIEKDRIVTVGGGATQHISVSGTAYSCRYVKWQYVILIYKLRLAVFSKVGPIYSLSLTEFFHNLFSK